MRPPLNAGENDDSHHAVAAAQDASMRPPLNAGENVPDDRHGRLLVVVLQ